MNDIGILICLAAVLIVYLCMDFSMHRKRMRRYENMIQRAKVEK